MRGVLKRRRPSPALVLAAIAFFVAIGGVAGALPGVNSVNSGDIKNGTVKSVDIKDNNVKGVDVNEGTLGTVPNATNAANANSANNANTVGGNSVVAFHLNGAGPIAPTQILSLDGLVITASCTAGGSVTANASTTVNDGEISFHAVDASSGTVANFFDDTFNVGDANTLPSPTNTDVVGEGRYTGGDLRIVTLSYNEEDSVGANNCLFNGFATGS